MDSLSVMPRYRLADLATPVESGLSEPGPDGDQEDRLTPEDLAYIGRARADLQEDRDVATETSQTYIVR